MTASGSSIDKKAEESKEKPKKVLLVDFDGVLFSKDSETESKLREILSSP